MVKEITLQNDYEKDILDEKLTKAFGEVHDHIRLPDWERFDKQLLVDLQNTPQKKAGFHRYYLLAAMIPFVLLPVVYIFHQDKTEIKKEIVFNESVKKETAEPAHTKPHDDASRSSAGKKREAEISIAMHDHEMQKNSVGATAKEEMKAMVPEIPPTAMRALEDEKAETELLKKLSLSKNKAERLDTLKKLEKLYTKIGETKKLKSVQNEISSIE